MKVDQWVSKTNAKKKRGGFYVEGGWDLKFPPGVNVMRDERGAFFVQNGAQWVRVKDGDWISFDLTPAVPAQAEPIQRSDFTKDYDIYVEPEPVKEAPSEEPIKDADNLPAKEGADANGPAPMDEPIAADPPVRDSKSDPVAADSKNP